MRRPRQSAIPVMVADIKLLRYLADGVGMHSQRSNPDPMQKSSRWMGWVRAGASTPVPSVAIWKEPEDPVIPAAAKGAWEPPKMTGSEAPQDSFAPSASQPPPAPHSPRHEPIQKQRAGMTLGELLYAVLMNEGRMEDEPA
ncbi:MAG: hypothetical protein ACLGQU_08820 [Acidobacteriota bacterium]